MQWPFFISSLILGFGWITMYGPAGFVSTQVRAWVGTVPWNLYSIPGMAVTEVDKNGSKSDIKIGPYEASDDALRDGLEATYRHLAGIETDEQRRYALVDKANAVRRWTLR